MKIQYTDQKILVVLQKGELFIQSLLEACNDLNIEGGSFVGIGGAGWADLAMYDLHQKQYNDKRFDGPLEVSNVTGFIAKSPDNQAHVHAHATIAGPDMNASAGHLKELEVAGTLELVIDPLDKLTRKHDDETGLDLLDLGS